MKEFLIEFQSLPYSDLLIKGLKLLVIIVVVLFLRWLVTKAINRSLKENLTRYRAKKVSSVLAYIIIGLTAFFLFIGDSQNVALAFGLISAGLAFALQEVILAVAGWMAIYTANYYSVGDRIEINDVKGDVIDISATKTTLMEIGDWVGSDNYNGRITKISNSFVFKSKVRNYSSDFPFLWDEVHIPIKYTSDIKRANELINEVCATELSGYADFAAEHWKKMTNKYMIENAKVDPSVTYTLTDNWVGFTIRYVVDYKSRRYMKFKLQQAILDAVKATDGAVEFASATFEIAGTPEMKVELKKAEE